MNYKSVISGLLLLSATACQTSGTGQAWPSLGRFQMRDSVVLDTDSHLMWSRCLLGATWNGFSCVGKASTYSWKQIQTVAKTLNYAGYSDWRVPTLDELKQLAETESGIATAKIPVLNPAVFPRPNCPGILGGLNNVSPNCWEWTTTPIEHSDNYAWIVYFGYGYGSGSYNTDKFALRLVRND